MAGGSQTLTSTIVINAVGNGIDALGSTLQQLGNRISGLSSQLIEFGKESLDVYREYELSMKDAEVALATTYGRGTTQLSNVMKQLDEQATEWAATSVFHTNDVANAISEAAHAGWDFNQIMAGIPAAIELANAGSMDLSDAVNYIVKSTNAAGVEFEDIGSLIDHWAYAANSSATTIDEMGEAMLRMGATMKFAGGTDEVLVLLAALANAGTVGSDAGTLLRNSMLRLVAPTKKAKEAMEELGASQEEITEVMENEEVAAANAALATAGFSAYDEQGNLKDMLTIFTELATALDQIGDEETQNAILSSIFPTRSITGAMNLWNAAKNGFDGLYESIQRGDAEGYGEYAMTEKLQTLNGEIEIFESKIERLKQVTGEELSGDLIPALSSINGFVDGLANMDDASFSALVGGLEVIAGAGPALLTTGTALRFIAWVFKGAGPAGAIALTAIGLTAAFNAARRFNEEMYKANFGEMSLDHAALSDHIQSIADKYDTAYAEANKFRGELEECVAAYENASQAFSSTLLTDVLTKAELTDADKEKLISLGDEMFNTLSDSIEKSYNKSDAYWTAFFGGADEAEGNDAFQDIISILDSGAESAFEEARTISNNLKSALNEAFADGHLDDAEYNNIMSYVQDMHRAMAEAEAAAQSEQDYVDRQKILHKAATASYEEVRAASDELAGNRDAYIAKKEDEYLDERYRVEYQAKKRGDDEATINALLAQTDAEWETERQGIMSDYAGSILSLWNTAMSQSDFGAEYQNLMGLAGQVMTGSVSAQEAYETAGGYRNASSGLRQTLVHAIDALGGYDELFQLAQYAEANGNGELATQLMQTYTGQQIASGFKEEYFSATPGYARWLMGSEALRVKNPGYSWGQTAVEAGMSAYETRTGTFASPMRALEQAQALMSGFSAEDIDTSSYNAALSNATQLLSGVYDLAAVYQDVGQFQGMGAAYESNVAANALIEGTVNAADYELHVTPVVDEGAIQDLPPVDMPVNIVPNQGVEDPATALQNQGVDVQVNGDTAELQATIQAENGTELMSYVDGDASNLHMKIMAEDGRVLTENVYANTGAAQAAINSLGGQTVTVYIQGVKMFAAGGRATSASVFGEAGPEWAIPEEHTERTAELLNAAREASGFTWPDLIARFGGLGASADNTPSTLIYSPTINAVDAAGVDQVLLNDKTRLDRWYEERKMRDRAEVFYA